MIAADGQTAAAGSTLSSLKVNARQIEELFSEQATYQK